MAGSSLKKRAMRMLALNPAMKARDLQEALHCSKTTAYALVAAFKKEQRRTRDEHVRAAEARVAPVLTLHKGKTRTPVQELPPATQDLVVEELYGLMDLIAKLRAKAVDGIKKLRAIEHSQLANAIGNLTKAMQTLCDTYPGLAQLTTRKAQDTVGLQDSDLADANNWLSAG